MAGETIEAGGDPCSLAVRTEESKDASWSISMEESREWWEEDVDPTPESCDAALRRWRRKTSLGDALGQASSSVLPSPSRPAEVLLRAVRWGGEAAEAASNSSCRRSIFTSSRAWAGQGRGAPPEGVTWSSELRLSTRCRRISAFSLKEGERCYCESRGLSKFES